MEAVHACWRCARRSTRAPPSGSGAHAGGPCARVQRGPQGQVWPRVPRVRVPPRRPAALRKQLQLQEGPHDPQGGSVACTHALTRTHVPRRTDPIDQIRPRAHARASDTLRWALFMCCCAERPSRASQCTSATPCSRSSSASLRTAKLPRRTTTSAPPARARWRSLVLSSLVRDRWPAPDRVGRQELEVVMGNEHISFVVRTAGSRRGACDRGPADGHGVRADRQDRQPCGRGGLQGPRGPQGLLLPHPGSPLLRLLAHIPSLQGEQRAPTVPAAAPHTPPSSRSSPSKAAWSHVTSASHRPRPPAVRARGRSGHRKELARTKDLWKQRPLGLHCE
jgi:hypothetical protein